MTTLHGKDFYTFEEYQEAKGAGAFPPALSAIAMTVPGSSPEVTYTAVDAIKNRYHGRLLYHEGDDFTGFYATFNDMAINVAADFSRKSYSIKSLLDKMMDDTATTTLENKRADSGSTDFASAFSDGGHIVKSDAGNANIGTIVTLQNQIKNLFDAAVKEFDALFLAYNPLHACGTGGSGSSGTKDHSKLENLDFDDAGHTGFQREITDLDTIRSGAAAGATAVQPAALATKQDVITDLVSIRSGAAAGATAVQPAALAGKQDVITDLASIRSGAAAGATAVQPTALAGKQDVITDLEEIRSGAAAGATAIQEETLIGRVPNMIPGAYGHAGQFLTSNGTGLEWRAGGGGEPAQYIKDMYESVRLTGDAPNTHRLNWRDKDGTLYHLNYLTNDGNISRNIRSLRFYRSANQTIATVGYGGIYMIPNVGGIKVKVTGIHNEAGTGTVETRTSLYSGPVIIYATARGRVGMSGGSNYYRVMIGGLTNLLEVITQTILVPYENKIEIIAGSGITSGAHNLYYISSEEIDQ